MPNYDMQVLHRVSSFVHRLLVSMLPNWIINLYIYVRYPDCQLLVLIDCLIVEDFEHWVRVLRDRLRNVYVYDEDFDFDYNHDRNRRL